MIVNLPVTAEAAVLGQIVSVSGSRLSAVLAPVRGPGAAQVRIGDLLRIEDVDATRNRCIVSYAGSGPPGEAP